MERAKETEALKARYARLSPRLRQVAHRYAGGETYRQTAAALGLSRNTVSVYLQRIYVTLRVHSRDELRAALALVGEDRPPEAESGPDGQ